MGNLAHALPALPSPSEQQTADEGSPYEVIVRGTYAAVFAEPADNLVVRRRLKTSHQLRGLGPPYPRPRQVFHVVAIPEPRRPLDFETVARDTHEWLARDAARLIDEHYSVITPLRREADRARGAEPRSVCEFLRLAEAVLVAAEKRLMARRRADNVGSLHVYYRFDASEELGRLVGLLVGSEAE